MPIKGWDVIFFYFLGEKSPARVAKVPVAILNPVNCPLPEKLISIHKFGLSLNLTAMLIVDLQVHVLTVTHL